jgi:hypothetical protein
MPEKELCVPEIEEVKDKDRLLEEFRMGICLRHKQVDPDEELDWFSLSYGFFIARGASIDDAHTLSRHARYDLQYWLL